MRTLASFECCATQSVVTSTSATAGSFRSLRVLHLIWTPSAAHAFRVRVRRAGRLTAPPLAIRPGERLEILQIDRARRRLPELGQHVAEAQPHEKQFAAVLEKELLIERA